MTVKADITSTLNGQTAELLLVEDSPDGTRKQQSRSLSGGTEELIFTSLDGGRDKRYTAKVIPSTTDVTQTSEIQFGAEIRIDPIPHRDSDATQKIRDGVEFNNGVAASQLGLGSSPLVSGLLTAALNDGEVLADDGSVHESVQAAQDAASSYIFIGPGTFNESVTIDTAGLTVQGSGYNTIIDGGSSDGVILSNSNISLKSLSVTNTSDGLKNDGGPDAIKTDTGADKIQLDNVTVRDSDERGINIMHGNDHNINNVTIEATDFYGIQIRTDRVMVSNVNIISCGWVGIFADDYDDIIISNCVLTNTFDDGISIGDDSIAIGCRIIGAGEDGAQTVGVNSMIANCRISGSAESSIRDFGSNNIFDSNNTGASN